MATLRKEIVERLKEIRKDEKLFHTEYWDNDFFSWEAYGGKYMCQHISIVKFEKLPPDELMRFFEWVIRNQVDVSQRRVHDLLNKM